MKEKRFGRILCVTSLSVQEPIENLAISNAVRAGVTGMLKTLADELAAYEITVNCVAPGAIATDRLNDLMSARIAKSGLSEEEYMANYLQAIPMGRLGSPEEFAAVVTFLASSRASYITGSTISVDGGKRRSTY
jgi:3-oxoacyl-[acyl-carrier protein] reductase